MNIQPMLHAQIVLSKRDLAKLRQAGFEDAFGGGKNPFGILTFLGNDVDVAQLFFRFPREEYGLPWVPMAIKEVFGVEDIVEFSNESNGFNPDCRVLIAARYDYPMMNPGGYIRAKAKHFATTAVRIFLGRVRGERRPDELWASEPLI